MADYIERENAYSAIRSNMFDKMRTFPKRRKRLIAMLLDLINVIGSIPAADVRENVHGEWGSVCGSYQCKNCGCTVPYDDAIMYLPKLNYCPNCGADMKGECSVCGHEIEASGSVPNENFCSNCGADQEKRELRG